MLKIKNLTKTFGSFTAVDNISLEINKGDLYGFLGPNGAGKTTTIKIITGLYTQTSGSVEIDGIDISKNHIEAKRIIGYIPDQPFLYEKLTGKEFLFFSGGLYQIPKILLRKKINEVIEVLNIGDWVNKRTEEYSQGMRQRITIASALLHDPKLIVVDEPMVGLDPQSAHVIKKLFKELTKNGTSIFMSTHSLNVVEEICNKVAIINNGKIIFNDEIDKLYELQKDMDRNLEQIFIQLTN
ncbi:MAG: ABC transporter ATP-binding protein [Melioribacteraceae bacterium]|nr:MAG: ABC transporter ATP-binding protein [Melioribacteraceae bacterium]